MAGIKFGTDGWRSIVGKDFNFDNVAIVTNSIGKYICDNYEKKEILIGYDPRNMAYEFANHSAKILCEAGFKVILSKKVVPTPVLAYGAKHHNACAIMFTASHNPPEYLGMKFIPHYAGPATNEITEALTKNLNEVLPKCEGGRIETYDFYQEYAKHISKLIDFEKIKGLKFIYDGLYSASIGYFDRLLEEHGITCKSLHMYHDTNFGGGMPEPKAEYLKELIDVIKNDEHCAGFSNDGDGDRFGVINENGEAVSANDVIGIIFLYLHEDKKLQGALVKNISSSLMLDRIAEKLSTKVFETPVGFKYIGELMRNINPIIGGEESGGLSVQGHIPEKDGIIADLLVMEAMAVKKMSIVELQEELYKFVGCRFINERINIKSESRDEVKNSIEKISSLECIAGQKITRKDNKDGIKLYLEDNSTWILVRPSGTEPLLRIAIESDSKEKIEQIKKDIMQ